MAAAVAAAVNADLSFSATAVGDVVTITTLVDGAVPVGNPGTSGFSLANTTGSLPADENITNTNAISSYPLTGTDVATIAATVNAGDIALIAPVGSPSLTITKSTQDDKYTYSGNATALAYGHNPNSPTLDSFVALYDGHTWVSTFQNSNPNFILKVALILNGVAPSIYVMNTAPNSDSPSLGEFFKLIPVTIQNIKHHLTQPAISQLPIISVVSISDDRKNVQIVSDNLGSAGAVEIVGGSGNAAKAYLVTESEVDTDVNGNTLLVTIPAFPDTFSANDVVMMGNDTGVNRLSRLISTDAIDVTLPSSGISQYNFDPKAINIVSGTTFTITDVSSTYGRPAGFVWRWTAGGSLGVFASVNPGDILFAYNLASPWAQGNMTGPTGNGTISGLPIVNANDTSHYIDVVNPNGKAMSSTVVGSGTVQICPTPTIQWKLQDAARAQISTMSGNGTTITVTTIQPHMLNSGDSVDIQDSAFVTDATYGPITTISANQFSFASAVSTFTETGVGASIIKSGLIPTRYIVKKLGFNGLVKLYRHDGASPHFTDSGVAVDDYLLISGTTFATNNSGIFRILAVDNDSILITNNNATDQLNTILPFNNNSLDVTWVAGTTIITGVAGTFKYLSLGNWVKKLDDPDANYLQVVNFNTGVADTATQVTLGGNYIGSTDIEPGVYYDELNNHNTGVTLQSASDMIILEGDSTLPGDSLFVQNIINTSWFSPPNIGTFLVSAFGTDPATFKPYIQVANASAIAEANRLMSVNINGLYVIESAENRYYSLRQVQRAALSDLNSNNRDIYLTPATRAYKFTNSNQSSIMHMGKLGYSTIVDVGLDGYTYYTGLLQRVQHTVDGYEPDSANFPGLRAVGGFIETLPPLPFNINIAMNISTNNGINLGDISNNIMSAIINYVESLGVGDDVILSEIIVAVMQINGVLAATFTLPIPSTERITLKNDEKAIILPQNISLANA